jgi:hypothetical protein
VDLRSAVKNSEYPAVIPAQAGIQTSLNLLDFGARNPGL